MNVKSACTCIATMLYLFTYDQYVGILRQAFLFGNVQVFYVNFFLYYDFYFTVIFSTTCYLCVLGLSLTTGATLQNVMKRNSSEDVDRERAIKRQT